MKGDDAALVFKEIFASQSFFFPEFSDRYLMWQRHDSVRVASISYSGTCYGRECFFYPTLLEIDQISCYHHNFKHRSLPANPTSETDSERS